MLQLKIAEHFYKMSGIGIFPLPNYKTKILWKYIHRSLGQQVLFVQDFLILETKSSRLPNIISLGFPSLYSPGFTTNLSSFSFLFQFIMFLNPLLPVFSNSLLLIFLQSQNWIVLNLYL